MEALTKVEENGEDVQENVLSFAIEFVDTVLRAAVNRDKWTASQLVKMLASIPLDLNI